MKNKQKPAGKSTPKTIDARDDAELDAFAHHLAEVLRIAKSADFLSTRFYRDLSGAWNECVNELKAFGDASIQESEEYVRLALKMEAGREGGAQ